MPANRPEIAFDPCLTHTGIFTAKNGAVFGPRRLLFRRMKKLFHPTLCFLSRFDHVPYHSATVLKLYFSVTVGIYTLVNRSKVKNFKDALNAYIEAVNSKQLTVEIIDNLVNALDKLKGKVRRSIQIEFSSDELTALIECLCNHTKTLAEANNINLTFEPTEEEKSDVLLMFRNNLVKQRDIFELAA